ncbi:DUF4112 domain-containing protein [Mesorhizobium sp. B2-3-13]|nr:DUF4112 domain-containing protein [Mesorhizobium sp. B2-3-13]
MVDRQTANAIAELDLLAVLLDSRWRLPATPIRFGLDALVGLVPVLGDAATGRNRRGCTDLCCYRCAGRPLHLGATVKEYATGTPS